MNVIPGPPDAGLTPAESSKHLASPDTNPQNTSPQATNPQNPRRDGGRGRGPRTVTAAEKAQAREVSLRRIGQLFAPYRWQLGIVTVIIAASSVVGLAAPFLLRAVIDN